MPFVNDRSEYPWKTIDRERNIALYGKYSNSDGEHGYELDVDGVVVKLKSRNSTMKNKDNEWFIKRTIFGLYIPPKSKLKKEQVIQLIEDAFQVYGATCGKTEMDYVETNFSLGD